jgi:alpha-L-fucosidase
MPIKLNQQNMKRLLILGITFFLCVQVPAQEVYNERWQRTEWFREARFGMFIHWGVYAIPARGEWVRNKEKLSVEDYQPFVDSFNPVEYNPRVWAKAAKKAGMKYAVMTAKHHDGFCLFDSKFTEYKSTNTPAGRDLIREYAEAFRAEGLKVGFYYSLLDWHHPDYPHYGDGIHPESDNEAFKGIKHNLDNYITYMHNQVRELVTNYGKIDIMWFDFSYGKMSGDTWKATELVKMVRQLQPAIIIDNRLGGNMEAETPDIYAGDFEGPEQVIPHDGIFDEKGRPIPWEACITLNNDWGYSTNDDYKSAADVVHALVNVVSKGGNLLLNVGPDARGNIPDKSLNILTEVGKWMSLNGESIYRCGPAPYPKPEWGRFTMKNDVLHAHILSSNIGQYYMKDMKGKIRNARLVADGREVFLGPFWLGERSWIGRNDIYFNIGKPLQWTFPLPDKINTVVRFDLVGN